MKGLLTIPLLVALTNADPIFTSRKSANQHLTRHRRDNGGIFEEVGGGNLQRECIDEICSLDEVREATDSEAEALAFWNSATKMCNQPNACHRSGTQTCVNKWRSRECQCKEGWVKTLDADDCSVDRDECEDPNHCANGGTCENLVGSFTCTCQNGWGGARCNEDIDECAAEQNPCANGGECNNTDGSFTCTCPPNWTGELCDIDVNECLNDPCQNGSSCLNLEGSYECVCSSGWGGQNCDEDFNECDMGLCPEGSICVMLSMNQFTCECPERGCNNADEAVYNDKLAQIESQNAPEIEEPEYSSEYNAPEYDTSDSYTDYQAAPEVTEPEAEPEATESNEEYTDNYGIQEYSENNDTVYEDVNAEVADDAEEVVEEVVEEIADVIEPEVETTDDYEAYETYE